MSSSKKTEVFETLFDRVCRRAKPWVVTNGEIVAAIRDRNKRHSGEKGLSPNNPANFLKDFIRTEACNANWPATLKRKRITARQKYGNGQVFEFVHYMKGDRKPFPDRYEPVGRMPVIDVESLSIPRVARALGRKDEAWLIQVIVNQRIAHTHFATLSPHEVQDFTHLQMSVKTQPEIDAVFMATIDLDGDSIRALITCEAKQIGERLLENQIREQVQQAFQITAHLPAAVAINAVIPIAVRVVRRQVAGRSVRGIYFLEFEMIRRADFDAKYTGKDLYDMPLSPQSKAFYVVKPEVAGVS